MDWFIAALISAFSMALAWLTLKKAQEKGLDSTYSLAVYFIISVISLIFYQLINNIAFFLPSWKIGLYILGLSFLPIISNLLIISAFERSPNPGIVLALNSTQTIWLFGAGIFLFEAVFSILSSVGIMLIFLGVASLHQQNKNTTLRWIILGLIAGIINASYWILLKKLQSGLPSFPLTTLFIYLVLPSIPIYFLIGRFKKVPFNFSRQIFSILLFSGLAGTIANIASLFAITTAPNPGYAQATASSSAFLTLLLAPLFSNTSTLKLKHFLSAVLIIIGVVLLKLAG